MPEQEHAPILCVSESYGGSWSSGYFAITLDGDLSQIGDEYDVWMWGDKLLQDIADALAASDLRRQARAIIAQVIEKHGYQRKEASE